MSDYEDEKEIDRLAKLVERLTEEAASLRAEVGRLEKALAVVRNVAQICGADGDKFWCSEGGRKLYELVARALDGLPAQPAPEKPALYPECPECGGTSWELDTSGSVTRHCADCGAEIQPFSADELARSEKVVKRVMLTITPCGYGCKDGKNGREIWINEACPTHSRAVGFNDAIGGESICKPAPEKPAERLTPHGRIIHEKNAIDVSGFPYPPETMDNEPGEPAGGGK